MAEGLRQAVARYGIRDVTIEDPVPVDAFRNFQVWINGRELDVTAAFQEFANLLERYERDGGGDRPGWMVEMDRVFRIQFAGGDPITYWLTTPMHFVEPPAVVVRRYWEGIVDEVRTAPPGTRVFVCSHSGPIRAVAAAAVGHDPGEPNNVEDVRIRVAARPRARHPHLPRTGPGAGPADDGHAVLDLLLWRLNRHSIA